MKITKYAHSCVLVEEHGTAVLFDPGAYAELPEELPRADAIIITHKHFDHLNIDNLSLLAQANPDVKIICNTEVASQIDNLNFNLEILEQGQNTQIGNLAVEAFGKDHALIHPSMPAITNTGYLLAHKVWYPGDSLTVLPQPVEILLLPIVAPWSKISETLDFVAAVKPKVVIPVHDGFLKFGGPYYAMVKQWCESLKIQFFEEINYQSYGD
ncbi:MAG TPA: MBL fold metallo-hydrolase [Candidatus Doudnabacteria bacterium]|nr:MBL fold metallo-hydrolase [Candidatus Doudnabacteria bacterium]